VNPIDLCIALNGPHVEILLPIALETLRRHDVLDSVHLHFVDKDCSLPVKKYLASIKPATVHNFTSPDRYRHSSCPDSGKEAELDVVNGTVTTLEWMWRNCGVNDWVFIMHFDVEFKAPWLGYYRGKIAPGVGQIGDHACGLVGYNRHALRQCTLGFGSMSGFYLVKNHYGRWKLRHSSDPRCNSRDIPVEGFDTNELLELSLQHFGWQVIVETDVESNKWRIHNGSGSGRCENANQIIRERAAADLKRLKIEPIR
jgi:hypothetical protein